MKFPLFEKLKLVEQQLFHLFKSLSLSWLSAQHMRGVIFHHYQHRAAIKDFLLLVEVKINKSGCLVI